MGKTKTSDLNGISRFIEHNLSGVLIEAIELPLLNLGALQVCLESALDEPSSKPRAVDGDGLFHLAGHEADNDLIIFGRRGDVRCSII